MSFTELFIKAYIGSYPNGYISGASTPLIPVVLSSYFPDTLPFTVYGSGVGGHSTNYNAEDNKPGSLTVGYLSQASGNDGSAENGNRSLPYATIAGAISGGATELVALTAFEEFALTDYTPTNNVAFRRDGFNSPVYIRNRVANPASWVQEGSPNTSVYKASGTTGVGNILDTTENVTDPLPTQIDGVTGVPKPMSRKASVAEVQAEAGSYYDDGVDTYIHAWDSGAPVNADLILLTTDSVITLGSGMAGNTLWMEGFEIWGAEPLSWTTGTGGAGSLLSLQDVACRYADAQECLDNRGAPSIYNRVKASHSRQNDAISYTGNLAYEPLHIEIDCEGMFAGYDTAGNTDNGSTCHNVVNVVRIDGSYKHNRGMNIEDVLGAQSYNIGCETSNSLASSGPNTAGFATGQPTAARATIMFMQDCGSSDSDKDRVVSAGTYMIDFGGFVGSDGDTGTVTDGTSQAALDAIFNAINTASPTFTGAAEVGEELSGDEGTWTGVAPITYSYQWQRSDDGSTGWASISGATAIDYTLVEADDEKYVRLCVTGTTGTLDDPDAFSTTVAYSAASAQIGTPAAAPLFHLDASDESTITDTAGVVDTWADVDANGVSFAPISNPPTTGASTLNSLNIVDFADDGLTSGVTNFGGVNLCSEVGNTWTVAVVVGNYTNGMIISQRGPSLGTAQFALYKSGVNTVLVLMGGTANVISPAHDFTSNHVIVISCDNGVVGSTAYSSFENQTEELEGLTKGAASEDTTNNICLGMRSNGADRLNNTTAGAAYVAEFKMLDTATDAAGRAAIIAELKAKWGI